jgi:putative DNA primase/helicase
MSAAAPLGAMLPLALDYATRRRWPVLPLRGKVPDADLATEGLYNATKSGATIGFWWSQAPGANVGIVTGERSGLLVVDVDPDGLETLARLEAAHGPLPRTVRVRTGRGGEHVYFRYPRVGRYKNTAKRLGPGIDTRGEGGYVVAVGSVHPSTGRHYEWLPGHSPDDVEIAEAPAWLLALLQDKPAPPAAPVQVGPSARRGKYAERALEDELRTVSTAIEGTRNPTLNEAAFSLGQLVGAGELDEPEVSDLLLQAALGTGLGEREAAATIRSGLRAGMREPREIPPPTGAKVVRLPPVRPPSGNGARPTDETTEAPSPPELGLTDLGNARRLVRHRGARLRYCHPWRKPLVYDDRRWVTDDTGQLERWAKDTLPTIYGEAAAEPDDKRRLEIVKWGQRSESRDRLAAMVALAQTEPGVPIMPDQLDRDLYMLNALNGTIDLRADADARFRDHRLEDYISKLAPVRYDPAARCPAWERFLREVFAGDEELIAFVQRLFGSCLTGDVREHVLAFLYGSGRNGKSTLVNTVLAILGDYGMTAAPDLLMAKRDGNHPTELADLFGKRLVSTIEVEEGRRMAESLVKALTGGDRIRARRMREDHWEFQPTHKILLVANHRPQVRGTDTGIWSRIKLIPFTVSFKGREDPALKTKLAAEASGILNWLIDGCLAWQLIGLGEPSAVSQATDAYRAEQDVLATFLAECTVAAEHAKVPLREMYAAYTDWCQRAGERAEAQRFFDGRLHERGFATKRNAPNGANAWQGIGLVATEALKDSEANPPLNPPWRKEAERRGNQPQSASVLQSRRPPPPPPAVPDGPLDDPNASF